MREVKRVNMFALGLLIICIVFGALGQISMKNGMNHMDKIDGIKDLFSLSTVAGIMTNQYVVLGLLLYSLSAFLWLGALSTLDVSFMYPLLSLAYVVTAGMAYLYLGESVSLFRWAGIVLVIAGCVLITRS
ncbi:MAG TPA: EamA family transporter [Methanotrichaceae archaeon]|nr:EamA family transporter [Methanotrichaceae archaeon]